MTQITIEVPDELAQRLEPFQNQLSELLTRLIASNLPDDSNTASLPATYAHTAELPTIYLELLDFLVSRPTAQQILEFKVSEQSQNRLQTLLQRNREAVLSATEAAELDLYEQLDNMMSHLKVRAYTDRNPDLQNAASE
jgi:hypothetical protein